MEATDRMKLAVKSDYQGLSSGPRITRASLNVEEGAEESEGDVTGGKWPERHNSAGFESGKGAMSQEMWAALEAGKKNVIDSPLEPPGRNITPLLTP